MEVAGHYNERIIEVRWVNCQEANCKLWTEAEVRNEQPGIVGFIPGCALQLLARKGLGNYIHAK